MHSLHADIAAISDTRRTLLDEVRGIAARLEAVVAEAEPTEHETSAETAESPEPTAVTSQTKPQGPRGWPATAGTNS
jgi:hypothetical protein